MKTPVLVRLVFGLIASLLSTLFVMADDNNHAHRLHVISDGLVGNPYGVAGYISPANLITYGYPAGLQTYDWNNLHEQLNYEMVRPSHYLYRYYVPGGNYVDDWGTYDVENQPKEWFTQESYPTDAPWNVRRGCYQMVLRYWGYYLDRTDGNVIGQIGFPVEMLPQWYIDEDGNHQERFDAWIAAHPNKIWLLGNEPEGFETVQELGGQDALTDVEYVVFYHTYHAKISSLDGGALFATAGMPMTTSPTWKDHLKVESVIVIWERILGIYAATYGEEMPVDIWNMHLYAGHGCWDPDDHRAEFVGVIEAFSDFVNTTRNGHYCDAPLILTEFNGTYDASGFTAENVAAFCRDFREDLHSLWIRGVLDQWFWFVSNGGTYWPEVSLLQGGALSIVGEEYSVAAWHWENLLTPIDEEYGRYTQPFSSSKGGLWNAYPSGITPAGNSVTISELFSEYARVAIQPGSTASETTLVDDQHLAGTGTFAFLEGQGAGVDLSFAVTDPADGDLFVGYYHGNNSADDGQVGVVLHAPFGDTSNTSVHDAYTGTTLSTGIDFTQRHKLFMVVNNAREIQAFLDDTTQPLGLLSRTSLPNSDTQQLRFGSCSSDVFSSLKFEGHVDVYAYAVDDDILHSGFAASSPSVVSVIMSDLALTVHEDAVYSMSITARDFNSVDEIADMRVVLHDDAPFAPENSRVLLAWGQTDGDIARHGGQWTIAGDATGDEGPDGRWGWRSDGWGADTYITPISAATHIDGIERTVTFTFQLKSAWELSRDQRVFVSTGDDQANEVGWAETALRFGVVNVDFDHDSDVDQADFGHFQACLSGSGIAQSDPTCRDAQIDIGDDDVDSDDLSIFKGCMAGANIPFDPGCIAGND